MSAFTACDQQFVKDNTICEPLTRAAKAFYEWLSTCGAGEDFTKIVTTLDNCGFTVSADFASRSRQTNVRWGIVNETYGGPDGVQTVDEAKRKAIEEMMKEYDTEFAHLGDDHLRDLRLGVVTELAEDTFPVSEVAHPNARYTSPDNMSSPPAGIFHMSSP